MEGPDTPPRCGFMHCAAPVAFHSVAVWLQSLRTPMQAEETSTVRHWDVSCDDWERLAREDPLWAILTDPSKRKQQWDQDAFFATGLQELEAFWPEVERRVASWSLAVPQQVLDYGCGVGRVSQAFAAQGLQVLGLDIAPTMIDRAQSWNQYPERCTYAVATSPSLSEVPSASYDLVYCALVLQHVPRPVALALLQAFVRVLRPQGLAAVQVVITGNAQRRWRRWLWQRLPRRVWRWFYQWRGEGQLARIPMYPLPVGVARRAITRAGGVLREAQPNAMAGPEWRSVWLWITRSSPSR